MPWRHRPHRRTAFQHAPGIGDAVPGATEHPAAQPWRSTVMPNTTALPPRRRFTALRALCLAGAATAALGFGGGAEDGQCPADKVVANSNLPNIQTMPRGVTDTVLGHIDLGREAIAARGHQLRLRRLVVQPGGVVP